MGAPSPSAWIVRLQRWAEKDPNVRLALIVGSQARGEMPADGLSDIDVAVFARDPARLLRRREWIDELGSAWASHLEPNGLETGEERRVLFDDGQDVDFAVFPIAYLPAMLADASAMAVLRRGFRTLVDKDGTGLTAPDPVPATTRPTEDEFSNLVNDDWFHLVWAAKKLKRGELLTALGATNGYLGALLVRAARWHALACRPGPPDVWHGARFFERWADPRVVRELPGTIASYDPASIARALKAHRALFGWLTEEIRVKLDFAPAIARPAPLSSYLDSLLGPAGA